jgi:hypothetical protein
MQHRKDELTSSLDPMSFQLWRMLIRGECLRKNQGVAIESNGALVNKKADFQAAPRLKNQRDATHTASCGRQREKRSM